MTECIVDHEFGTRRVVFSQTMAVFEALIDICACLLKQLGIILLVSIHIFPITFSS